MQFTKLEIILARRLLYAHRRRLIRAGKWEEAAALTRLWNLAPLPEKEAA